jgi:hypothetical protein
MVEGLLRTACGARCITPWLLGGGWVVVLVGLTCLSLALGVCGLALALGVRDRGSRISGSWREYALEPSH